MTLVDLFSWPADWAATASGLWADALAGRWPDALVLAWPWMLLCLPMPWLAHRFLPPARDAQGLALRVPGSVHFTGLGAEGSGSAGADWFSRALLVILWVALVLAAARPQSFGEPLASNLGGRDLMLAIDISGSMRETDLYNGRNRATRMAVVKQVASDFVARREADRIGLIMFGSQAYVQTPLTHDHKTVQHYLQEAAVGLAGRSTAIGDAIGLGVKRLRDRPADSRVLILLTDGENSAGVVQPLEAAERAAELGVRVHTIGVGAEAGSAGVMDLALGARRSQLDERTLQAIASSTGGQYFRARNRTELEAIYARIDELEPSNDDERAYRPLSERFVWPLSMALLASLAWAVRRHWSGVVAHV